MSCHCLTIAFPPTKLVLFVTKFVMIVTLFVISLLSSTTIFRPAVAQALQAEKHYSTSVMQMKSMKSMNSKKSIKSKKSMVEIKMILISGLRSILEK